MNFRSSSPSYNHLRKKWIQKHKNKSEEFVQKHAHTLRRLTLGGLGGLILLTTPGISHNLPINNHLLNNKVLLSNQAFVSKDKDNSLALKEALGDSVPTQAGKLTPEEEAKITAILSDKLNLSVKAELNGIRLNTDYGLIGGEQHLYRYPGDNLMKHSDNASDWAMYSGSGMAPGLGAWGYFTPSEASFTQEDKMRERYYIAVQTFLAPGYSENVDKYRDFFKYRKMLVVNPKTGQAVVADIADAGPAEWTGKQLGGSPEVMQAVGLAQGPRKGAVLYFFIDDPDNKVPLGPIQMKETNTVIGI